MRLEQNDCIRESGCGVPQSVVLMESVLIARSDARHIPASSGAPLYTALCRNDFTVIQGGLRPSVSMSRPSTDEQSLDDVAPARKNITTLEGKHYSPSSPFCMEEQHHLILGALSGIALGALLQKANAVHLVA